MRAMTGLAVTFRGLNHIFGINKFAYKCAASLLLNNSLNISASQKRFAGHAKWQNIAHTKSKTDAARAKLHSLYAVKLRKAVREGGGSVNPAVNTVLKNVIEEAKRMNVRKEVIDRALDSMANLKIKPHVVEAIGPGGCFVVINCETDNISVLRHDIKKALRKTKCALANNGVARFAFQEKGYIRISKKDLKGVPLTFEKVEELAIEAGAEEVNEEEIDEEETGETNGSEKNSLWLLSTASEDLYTAKQYIEENAADVEIISAELEFTATNPLELRKEEYEELSETINNLEELSGIVKVYTNVKYV